jgi:hypothetical protein
MAKLTKVEVCKNCDMPIFWIPPGLHSRMDYPDGRWYHESNASRLCTIAEASPAGLKALEEK